MSNVLSTQTRTTTPTSPLAPRTVRVYLKVPSENWTLSKDPYTLLDIPWRGITSHPVVGRRVFSRRT